MSALNELKEMEASGALADDIYQPKLWCYQSLQFSEDTCEMATGGDSNLELNTLRIPMQKELLYWWMPQSAPAASSNKKAPNKKVQIQNNANKLQTQSKLSVEKKRRLEGEEYARILKDCSTAMNMLSRHASPPRVEPDKNENSLFGKYITSEINEIEDYDILDEGTVCGKKAL
ncbi:hypothetical protein JTB14_018092 [Gonioctena quinquepunctata]|nr:hypothetical protein JTB14_018092 [Gonioctena quinquepunctata]